MRIIPLLGFVALRLFIVWMMFRKLTTPFEVIVICGLAAIWLALPEKKTESELPPAVQKASDGATLLIYAYIFYRFLMAVFS